MVYNLLTAIEYLVNNNVFNLKEFYDAKNRANNMGASLEEYVKDIFAQTLNESDDNKRNLELNKTFSYLGNPNNPPDSILKGGDAIEVKKVETIGASLALNSSYPKDMLRSSSPMITQACRECEEWEIKDIFYVIGYVADGELKKMFIVYGKDYAADYTIYERIRDTIKKGVESIENVEFSESKELGHIKSVDPLGITYLRIRGMWGIDNPSKVFAYITKPDMTATFELNVIINNDKFNSFPQKDIDAIMNLALTKPGFKILNIKIKNPNNPAKLIDAKHISYII